MLYDYVFLNVLDWGNGFGCINSITGEELPNFGEKTLDQNNGAEDPDDKVFDVFVEGCDQLSSD